MQSSSVNALLSAQNSSRIQDVKLLQNFLDVSSSATKKGAKSMVQMSKDGKTIICTRYNSALARFFARVFTKLSSMDFYDKFSISKPERQLQAVETFRYIMANKRSYEVDEPIVANKMSLNELRDFLKQLGISPQDTGANVLRKMFSISNIDKNKIASGDFKVDLQKFADINIDKITDVEKENLDMIYRKLKSEVQKGMEAYLFSDDEIGYVLASIIAELKPVLSKTDDLFRFRRLEGDLCIKLSYFIVKYSGLHKYDSYGTDDIKGIADNALKIMKDFAEFSDFVRGIGPGEDMQPGLAKTALLSVLNVAASIVAKPEVEANVAEGYGVALAALVKFSSQASDAKNPQLARCASFEPILNVLKICGLMQRANNSYNNAEENGKITSANVKEAWDGAATKFIQELAPQQT